MESEPERSHHEAAAVASEALQQNPAEKSPSRKQADRATCRR